MNQGQHKQFMDDTQPRITVQAPDEKPRPAGWQRAVGWLSLLGALAFSVATLVLLVLPQDNAPLPDQNQAPQLVDATDAPQPTQPMPTTEPIIVQGDTMPETQLVRPADDLPPSVDSAQLVSLLATPFVAEPGAFGDMDVNPFTIIPDRPRNEFIEYTVQPGDTIFDISRRYGLAQETFAWCNDREIIFVLRPGSVLRIPPTDGACHQVLGTQQLTIQQIAERYDIADAYDVIESGYNPELYGLTPEDTLPGGVVLFLPGGIGPDVNWNPGYETETDDSGNVSFVTFASGQNGSCGRVPASGGTVWTNPLPNGRWTRGFSVGHSGIDLAASTGTPILAANGGPVLFSGFSRFGYGETVVLAHGRQSTLYGHMSSRAVGCGQNVPAGTVIGYVGSTGNSSGPHLHFEIRFDDEPQDPTATPGIGW